MSSRSSRSVRLSLPRSPPFQRAVKLMKRTQRNTHKKKTSSLHIGDDHDVDLSKLHTHAARGEEGEEVARLFLLVWSFEAREAEHDDGERTISIGVDGKVSKCFDFVLLLDLCTYL